MRKTKNPGLLCLIAAMVLALFAFLALYKSTEIPIEEPQIQEQSPLETWSVEESVTNGRPLREFKDFYTRDNNIYDVYLSVFPTKDEDGNMIDFSAFDLHQSGDHTYNPTLNCNIQILSEDEKPDPLASLDTTNASIRVRGNSSRGARFKSYKVKLLDENDSFQGQTTLNINKHYYDYSKVTTKFCTDILQDMENMASYRTNFMRVWIRDTSLPEDQQEFKYYGLYTHTEQPNKAYLDQRGLSASCSLYKARDFSFRHDPLIVDIDDPNYSEEAFEQVLGIREVSDHHKLLEMLDVVGKDTMNIQDVMGTYFNEDNYLDWLAFNILVGSYDIINHNFLLYNPDNSLTWYFIPWDFDGNLKYVQKRLPESLRGGQTLTQIPFHRKYFRVPGNLEKLDQRMQELMQGPFSRENIQSIVEGYIPVLEKTMTLEPDIDLIRFPMEEYLPFVRSFPELIQKNYDVFKSAFQHPAPMFVAMPQKNQDGTVHLAWDSSYSYQGRTISYDVIIARDCHLKDIVYQKEGVIETSLDTDIPLEPDVYYLQVTAVDSEGNRQYSLEHYQLKGAVAIYKSGLLEFKLG